MQTPALLSGDPAGALPDRMLAAACDGAGSVRIESRPRPVPGPGEMLLRLSCAGLCGTDLYKLRHGTAAAGTVLGHEIVGTVAALGAGVRGFAPGDRVAVPHHVACGECALCRRGSEPLCPAFAENLLVPGGFAEWVLVRERAVRAAAFGLPPTSRTTPPSSSSRRPACCAASATPAWPRRRQRAAPSSSAPGAWGSSTCWS